MISYNLMLLRNTINIKIYDSINLLRLGPINKYKLAKHYKPTNTYSISS